MSYTNGLDDPTLYFNTKLYTGNGSTQSITGVGFQPDWVWIKRRDSASSHRLQDSVRGAGEALFSDLTNAETTDSTSITSFDSDGFSLGNSGGYNNNTATFASWNWLAGGTASSNTDGSITSSVSANTTSGFSIVSYTGNGTSGATIGHGLSAKPSWIVTKRRNSAEDWANYHSSLTANNYMYFTTNASTDDATKWNDTEPTSSVFSVGNHASVNGSSDTYIAYCFEEKKGFSKAFSYTGNGSTNGSYIHLGFKPAWVMLKRTDSANSWPIWDNKRNPHNVGFNTVYANESSAEFSATYGDFLSSGLKLRSTSGAVNASGGTYIGFAIAENPFVTSTGIPTTAR